MNLFLSSFCALCGTSASSAFGCPTFKIHPKANA